MPLSTVDIKFLSEIGVFISLIHNLLQFMQYAVSIYSKTHNIRLCCRLPDMLTSYFQLIGCYSNCWFYPLQGVRLRLTLLAIWGKEIVNPWFQCIWTPLTYIVYLHHYTYTMYINSKSHVNLKTLKMCIK